mgnify:CR=1 FL=1
MVVFLVTLGADRFIGWVAPPPTLPGTLELIFPPRSEQTFTSVDFTYTAHINNLGLRGRELPRQRGDAFRIAAIGDSYTYGWGVEMEDTWLRRLETILREQGYDVETVNLGKPGAGPPDYAGLAEKAIPVLRPDLVLVGMLQGNDLAASGPEGLKEIEEGVLDKVRTLYPSFVRMFEDWQLAKSYDEMTQERPPQVSTAEDNRRWTANTAREFHQGLDEEQRKRFEALDEEVRSAFLNGMLNPYMIELGLRNPGFYLGILDLDDPWMDTCIGRAAGQLGRIARVAGKYGAKVAVLSIPDGPYVNRHAYENIQRVGYEAAPEMLKTDSLDRGIELAAEQAGLPFFQATKAFRERKDELSLFFPLDGHMTEAGHALYAEAIAPKLEALVEAGAPRQ